MTSKTKFLCIATGGTIAGISDGQGGYRSGAVKAHELLQGADDSTGSWEVIEPYRIGSQHATLSHFCHLGNALADALSSPDIGGVLIVHGTDTLEELSIYLLARFGYLPKPVVMVASMRPSDHPQADGPNNLALGKRLLAQLHKHSGQWLPMLAMDNHVSLGADIAKRSATDVAAFTNANSIPTNLDAKLMIEKIAERSTDLFEQWVDYVGSAVFPDGFNDEIALGEKKAFRQRGVFVGNEGCIEKEECINQPERVTLIYVGVGMGSLDSIATRLKADDYHGQTLVVACPGNASLPEYLFDELKEALSRGTRVVLASRLGCEGIGRGNELNPISKQVFYAPVGWSLPQVMLCERLINRRRRLKPASSV